MSKANIGRRRVKSSTRPSRSDGSMSALASLALPSARVNSCRLATCARAFAPSPHRTHGAPRPPRSSCSSFACCRRKPIPALCACIHTMITTIFARTAPYLHTRLLVCSDSAIRLDLNLHLRPAFSVLLQVLPSSAGVAWFLKCRVLVDLCPRRAHCEFRSGAHAFAFGHLVLFMYVAYMYTACMCTRPGHMTPL